MKGRDRKSVSSTEHRTGRGQAVVEAWGRTRAPFILYLRSFRVTMYHGPERRMLLENHFWACCPRGIGMLTIVDPEEVPLPGVYGHSAPALAAPNERWPEVVSDLIDKAELIVSEIPVMSEGARFELATAEKAKSPQTVVILPAPGGPFPLIDGEEPISRFIRPIWYDELPPVGVIDHFVFRDLMTRMKSIAELAPEERLSLYESGEIRKHFPLTFEGLREGYEDNACQYEQLGDLRRASRSNFRALVIASMKIVLASKGYLAATDDESARISIVEHIARQKLALGDIPGAVNYLKGALKFAAESGDGRRADILRRNLAELEKELPT